MDSQFTYYLALYGAILSTIVFLWNLFKDVITILKDRPQLKVTMGRDGSGSQIVVAMVNPSKRPLTITRMGISYRNGFIHEFTPSGPSGTVELTEGKSYTAPLGIDATDEAKILYAWVRDATGKEYKSRRR